MGSIYPPSPRRVRSHGRSSAAPSIRPAPSGPEPRPVARGLNRPNYAAIDLGTNNCRLLVAQPQGSGFVVVDAFSRIVRLGEGMAASGRLSDAAMDRALSALSICADKLRRRPVTLARSVATQACRQASNGAMFIERVYRETGIALDVISAEEEAQLAVLGCHVVLEPGDGAALVFDIGGGSTELALIDTSLAEPRTIAWKSIPWGVVLLSEVMPLQGDTPDERQRSYDRMRAHIHDDFVAFGDILGRHRAGDLRLLGTSGTVTTLASLYLDLPSYDRRVIDGAVLPANAMHDISTRLARMPIGERAALPCIGRERADLVVAGCAILESILDIWPSERLGVADRGIREGILRSLMARNSITGRGR